MSKLYVVSQVICTHTGDPGTVTQKFFTTLDEAKEFCGEQWKNAFESDYTDQKWREDNENNSGFPLVLDSESAREDGCYDYFQIDEIDTENVNEVSTINLYGI